MKRLLLVGMLWVVAIPTVQAQVQIAEFRPTAAELHRLPTYCAVKFNSKTDSPQWQAMRSQFGKNFIDMHHYCAGLNFLNNRYYQARSASDKSLVLQRAKANFEYMQKAALPGFPLRADINLHHGITLRLMGQPDLAIRDLLQAIEINPGLTKAHLELVSLYRSSKQNSQAMDAVVAGLKRIPDSKALQRHYLELGGKEPFPEPVSAAVKPPVAEAVAVQTEAEQTTPAAGEQATEPSHPPAEATEAKPEIGAPGNPYCRFCPPPGTAN